MGQREWLQAESEAENEQENVDLAWNTQGETQG